MLVLVLFYFLLFVVLFLSASQKVRIHFGSCSKPYVQQPLWKFISIRQPDLFVWSGDVVYHDRPNISCTDAFVKWWRGESKYLQCHRIGIGPSNPELMQLHFEMQMQQTEYQRFLESGVRVIGVWDDHDYGHNNAGHTYLDKRKAKKAMLDFFAETNDIRRTRDGMYAWYSMSIPIESNNLKQEIQHISESNRVNFEKNNPKSQFNIDIYLLDIRWFAGRDKKYQILGKPQWEWLKTMVEYRKKYADMSIFVSGIQILPFYRGWIAEQWSRFDDRHTFLKFIADNVKNPVLVSGDVHFGEINQCAMHNGIILSELTSSGLTHAWKPTYPRLLFWGKLLASWLEPDATSLHAIHELNFGEVEIHLHSKSEFECTLTVHAPLTNKGYNTDTSMHFNVSGNGKVSFINDQIEPCLFEPKTGIQGVIAWIRLFTMFVIAVFCIATLLGVIPLCCICCVRVNCCQHKKQKSKKE